MQSRKGLRMEFIFETEYSQKVTKTMARVLRKTLRRKHNKRSHIFGWIVMALALLLVLPIGDRVVSFDFRTVITYLAILILLLVLIFEDSINGYIARKRMLKGTEKSKATFRDEGYYSETEMGNTEWQYDKIITIAETKDYFVFVFSPSHAQVYDKSNLTGGTVEEFSSFIKEKTQKELVFIR